MPRRVLLFSERNAETRKWMAQLFEFEDVIAAVDDVTFVAPPAAPTPLWTRVGRKLARTAGRWTLEPQPMVARQQVDGEYDLFFAVFAFPEDMAHLNRLIGWRERCRKAMCFVVEIYDVEGRGTRPYVDVLRDSGFDHVFIFNAAATAGVSGRIGAPAEFMPVGVDAFRYSPYPDPPPRTVDFYQYGRRSAATHAAALEMSARDGLFYLYDNESSVDMRDYRAHRQLQAEIMKRSRYFFAYRAAEDVERAAEDDDLSSRFFEGTGGGAVLLGSSPQTAEYRQCFDWDDATIQIPYEAHDLRSIVAELDAQPRRLAEARRNNILATLRRHDWGYRWARVLEAAGMSRTSRLEQRFEQLEALAAVAEEREGEAIARLA